MKSNKMNTKMDVSRFFMLKNFCSAVLLFFVLAASAQENPKKATKTAKKYMQEAEEALSENNFSSAEAFYRKAIAKDPSNATPRYNLGNLYFDKDISKEAVERHTQAASIADNKPVKHNAFHNQGNSFMRDKNYQSAIESYKNALRNDPTDEQTRYNLALAKKMLEKDKKDGKGGDDKKNQDQNKDQKKDQDQQDQDQRDQQDKDDSGDQIDQKKGEQDKQDKKDEGDQDKEKQNPDDQQQKGDKGQDENQENQPPKPVTGQLSPQQIKNLLDAMNNQEKKVQDKINAAKTKGAKVKTGKDW